MLILFVNTREIRIFLLKEIKIALNPYKERLYRVFYLLFCNRSYEDRTYDFKLKQPPASEPLKKAVGLEKGSGEPNKTKVGKITKAQLREIAIQKMPDLNPDNIEQVMKIIEGTTRSMGIEITT